MHNMLKKDAFCRGSGQTKAFNKLKAIMSSAPVLALPDFSKAFVLEINASGNGLGAILM